MATTSPGSIGTGYPKTAPSAPGLEVAFEPMVKGGYSNGGFPVDRPIPLGDWRTATEAALGTSAGATPYRALIGTSIPAILWRQDAAATDLIRTSLIVPGQYDPNVDDLRLIALIRKDDTDDTENATLNMQCVSRILTPGQANPALAATTTPAAPSALVGFTPTLVGDTALTSATAVKRRLAAAATTDMSNIIAYEFNLGNQGIKPCDVLVLELGPDATVGTTDLKVELVGTSLRWHTNMSIHRRELRSSDSAIFGN